MLGSSGYLFLKVCPGANDASGLLKNIILNFNSQSYTLEKIKYAVQQTHTQTFRECLFYFVSNPSSFQYLLIYISGF